MFVSHISKFIRRKQASAYSTVFWTDKSKAATIVKFQDRVRQVHRFFDKCHADLKMIRKTMFPLNRVPPTLLALISNFRNAKRVHELVCCQLLAGAKSAFSFVMSQHPSLDLIAIAQADGNLSQFFPVVKTPASIVVDRLENSTKVDDTVGISHE
jgi:hypothetical protein